MTTEMIVAATLWLEAAGETPEGIAMVADVIWNRTEDETVWGSNKQTWPNHVQHVCLKPKQFSCWNARDPRDFLPPAKTDWKWALCQALARQLVSGTFVPRTRATHYHNDTVSPKWAKNAEYLGAWGRHTFYRV